MKSWLCVVIEDDIWWVAVRLYLNSLMVYVDFKQGKLRMVLQVRKCFLGKMYMNLVIVCNIILCYLMVHIMACSLKLHNSIALHAPILMCLLSLGVFIS